MYESRPLFLVFLFVKPGYKYDTVCDRTVYVCEIEV